MRKGLEWCIIGLIGYTVNCFPNRPTVEISGPEEGHKVEGLGGVTICVDHSILPAPYGFAWAKIYIGGKYYRDLFPLTRDRADSSIWGGWYSTSGLSLGSHSLSVKVQDERGQEAVDSVTNIQVVSPCSTLVDEDFWINSDSATLITEVRMQEGDEYEIGVNFVNPDDYRIDAFIFGEISSSGGEYLTYNSHSYGDFLARKAAEADTYKLYLQLYGGSIRYPPKTEKKIHAIVALVRQRR